MYIEKEVIVTEVLSVTESIQLLATSAGAKRAVLYRDFFATVSEGDKLKVNTTATEMKLGTGGWDIVVGVYGVKPYQNKQQLGHVMKGRYTPYQQSVDAVEAQDSEFHDYFTKTFSLQGKPVILAELHSMLPILYMYVTLRRKDLKVTAIISDEASIPLMFSNHIDILREKDNFHTITIGQAFGGEYEAVNLWTALQFSTVVLQSDVTIVSLGPGVVGTGTLYGFSGMELANWANIIGRLHGKPVWVPRLSFAEKRERHFGMSHHTLRPLTEFTYATTVLPLPQLETDEQQSILLKQVEPLNHFPHIIVEWGQMENMHTEIAKLVDEYPVPIKTMGRTFSDDPAFFYGVGTAAQWALQHL